MSDERYDLYFKGDLLDGFFIDFVKADMARLFKTELERIEPFFTGQPQPVKLNVDKATAAKYQQALKGIGARLLVVPAGFALKRSTRAENARTAPEASQPAAAWSILPPGSDIGERREPPKVTIDTSRLSVARVGATLVDSVAQPDRPAIDTSSFTLAQPGARLVEADQTRPPAAPDTSHLTLE